MSKLRSSWPLHLKSPSGESLKEEVHWTSFVSTAFPSGHQQSGKTSIINPAGFCVSPELLKHGEE